MRKVFSRQMARRIELAEMDKIDGAGTATTTIETTCHISGATDGIEVPGDWTPFEI